MPHPHLRPSDVRAVASSDSKYKHYSRPSTIPSPQIPCELFERPECAVSTCQPTRTPNALAARLPASFLPSSLHSHSEFFLTSLLLYTSYPPTQISVTESPNADPTTARISDPNYRPHRSCSYFSIPATEGPQVHCIHPSRISHTPILAHCLFQAQRNIRTRLRRTTPSVFSDPEYPGHHHPEQENRRSLHGHSLE